MKKKRVILHLMILVMAVVSMGMVIFAFQKYEPVLSQGTKEDMQEAYRHRYVVDMTVILTSVRDHIEKGGKFIDFDTKMGGSDLGYKVVFQKENGRKKVLTYHWNEKNSKLTNRSRFDATGFTLQKDTADDFMFRFDADYVLQYYMDMDSSADTEKLYKEELKFLKKYNLSYEFAVNELDYGNLTKIKQKIEKAPTDEKYRQIEKKMITCFIIAGVIAILALIPFIYLLIIAGHKRKGDKPYTNRFDKIWMDVMLVAAITGYFVIFLLARKILLTDDFLSSIFSLNVQKLMIPWAVYNLFAIEGVIQISESICRRLKSKCFVGTTLTGTAVLAVKRLIMKMLQNVKPTIKVIIVGILAVVFMTIDFILLYDFQTSGIFAIIIFFVLPILAVCVILWVYFKEKQIIIEETEKIADGNVDNKIYDPMKFSSNKKLAGEINRIGEGMSKALYSSVKNERMKTELITNVSHDIKTPLTSIINYVDLLKTDGLDSEKAKEYLDILDRKSQRLKTLTEDLVEASKLNSGVIELKIEDIDIVQLVNQSLAEYNERFAQNDLHIIKNISRDTIIVKADGRKTWRALDNLYSNVCKYAMPGTRVYIDITEDEKTAVVAIKNISQGALNFSPDELMERFVRGDVSRTTEGSGLGLSIAKTIMERQNGSLKILLDGDLFKVEIRLTKQK